MIGVSLEIRSMDHFAFEKPMHGGQAVTCQPTLDIQNNNSTRTDDKFVKNNNQ
jgi:hypothetical protein